MSETLYKRFEVEVSGTKVSAEVAPADQGFNIADLIEDGERVVAHIQEKNAEAMIQITKHMKLALMG